jgi:serine/threonine-protein kinase SRPK3
MENLSSYVLGGLHPVHAGDIYNRQTLLSTPPPDFGYKILQKLEVGTSSTIWLAQNTLQEELVALKIMTAKRSETDKSLDHYDNIRDAGSIPPGRYCLLEPIDSLWIKGPNGRHLFLITHFAGPKYLDLARQMPSMINNGAVVKQAALGTMQAFAYIREIGLCYGDCRADKILMQLDNQHLRGEEQLLQIYGDWGARRGRCYTGEE